MNSYDHYMLEARERADRRTHEAEAERAGRHARARRRRGQRTHFDAAFASERHADAVRSA